MALRCEICGESRCACGGDVGVTISLARRDLDLAQRQVMRGLMMILLVPIIGAASLLVAAGLDSIVPLVAALLGVLTTLVGGVASIIVGTGGSISASRALKEAEARRALPVARLIE